MALRSLGSPDLSMGVAGASAASRQARLHAAVPIVSAWPEVGFKDIGRGLEVCAGAGDVDADAV